MSIAEDPCSYCLTAPSGKVIFIILFDKTFIIFIVQKGKFNEVLDKDAIPLGGYGFNNN
jgi:hypothetical protein